VGALLSGCLSFFGNHHGKRCKNALSQNRKKQRLNSSSDICTPGNLYRVWDTSEQKKTDSGKGSTHAATIPTAPFYILQCALTLYNITQDM